MIFCNMPLYVKVTQSISPYLHQLYLPLSFNVFCQVWPIDFYLPCIPHIWIFLPKTKINVFLICLHTIAEIFISLLVMWIYGLQAKAKSSSERFLSCCRHCAIRYSHCMNLATSHVKNLSKSLRCRKIHAVTAWCLQQLENLSELLLVCACRPCFSVFKWCIASF